jgi:uncharacterized protein YbjT (DUF2867 family)
VEPGPSDGQPSNSCATTGGMFVCSVAGPGPVRSSAISAYYREKAECERMIVAAPVPHTILRATQFHDFVATIFAAQKYSPVLFVPSISVQPIAVAEVGARLIELVDGAPVGRVDDIGGPELLTGRELATSWREATGSRRSIWPLRLPGKTFKAIASGHNLVPGEPYGRATFAEFLAERFGVESPFT